MKTQKRLSRNLILALLPAAFLLGCAGDKEFKTVPQEGANRTGTYPRFTNKPQAETAQFTSEESVGLTQQLDSEGQGLKSFAQQKVASPQETARLRDEAKREAEETLRQIEKGGQ